MNSEVAPDYAALWSHLEPESSRRLVLAALDCFAVHGYEASTTREIAKVGGLSPAGVYVHYRTKGDLLIEIMRTGHQAVWTDVLAAVDAATGPTETVVRFVEEFVRWHARYHTLARVCQYELGALPPDEYREVRALRAKFQRLLEGSLKDGNQAGEFDASDVRGTARAILSLGIDVARWYRDEGGLAPTQLSAFYGQLALRMVGGSSQ